MLSFSFHYTYIKFISKMLSIKVLYDPLKRLRDAVAEESEIETAVLHGNVHVESTLCTSGRLHLLKLQQVGA